MKTKQITSTLLVAFLFLLFSQCTKDQGTATINFQASMSKSTQVDESIALTAGSLVVEAAVIQIENIALEDNTGEDNNDELDDANDKDDKDDNDNIEDETEDGDQDEKDDDKDEKDDKDDAGDLILAGPFTLDVASGFATIGDVTVQPATYKKVNLNFVDGSATGVNSIEISGSFTDNNGATTPYTLSYNSADAIELPLADSGLVVTSGSTITLSIVFDVNTWLSSLDFSSAEIVDGLIEISATKNTILYQAFEAVLSENIDIED